jgi:ketosteroid isomerase-like protein
MKLTIWLLAAISMATAATTNTRDAESDRRDILRVEAMLCRAFEVGDAEVLRDGLDETFTLVDSRGVIIDRAQNLAEMASGVVDYEVFRNHDQAVRLYGDTAIVIGITTVKGKSGETAFAADFRFTDTWIRRDGGWRMAASHATRLPPTE